MITQVARRKMKRHELSILLSLLVVVSGCSTFTRRPVPEPLIDSGFCVAAIPDDEALPAEPRIDTQIQTRLFDCGYALARDGYPWATEPPGLRIAPQALIRGAIERDECDEPDPSKKLGHACRNELVATHGK